MNKAELLKAKQAEAIAILDLAEKEDRELTADEQTKVDALEAEVKQLQADIKAADEARKRRAEQRSRLAASTDILDQRTGRIVTPGVTTTDRAAGVPRLAKRYRTGKLRYFETDDEAYDAGQFYLAALWGRPSARGYCQEHGIDLVLDNDTGEKLAAGTTQESKGGYIVPDFLSNRIIDLREAAGVFRANGRVEPMPADVHTVPRRAGGVTAYFVGENSEVTASDKSWDNVTLTARKIAALCKYSTELDEGAIIDVAMDLTREIAYAFAAKEDACGFLGTGAQATYGGIAGLITKCAAATATVVTAITGNTAFSTLDAADFESMIGKLPEYPMIQPKWFISKAGWAASMLRLTQAAGGVTAAEMVNGVRQLSFMGYPVVFVQTMNTTLTAQTSTNGLVYFGDLAMASTLGSRRQITLRSSAERYFEYDQLAILGTQRFDINVHDVGDTTNPGAMIMLATPSS